MGNQPVRRWVLAAVVLISTAGAAQAASRFVANTGVDSATCGGSANPCRSIGQAIANAANGDSIRVGPGRYSPDTEPPLGTCDCLIKVDKSLKIEATEGAGGTVLDGLGLVANVVEITDGGVTFGLDHKGFTFVGGRLSGLRSIGNDGVEVHSNRAIGIECGPGFALSGVDVLATYNEAQCNGTSGFEIPGGGCDEWGDKHKVSSSCGDHGGDKKTCLESVPDGLLVRLVGNQAIGNHIDGFEIGSGTVELESNLATRNGRFGFSAVGGGLLFKFNAATGNVVGGFGGLGGPQKYDRNVASGGLSGFSFLLSSGITLEQNSVLGNVFGIFALLSDGVVATKNNIYGNDACGVFNLIGGPLSAIKNYWGAPSGPGSDPADDACGSDVTVAPWLSGPTAVPYVTGAGGSP